MSRTGESSFKHAVVMGGSMAGLMAARALSDTFDKVTIVERDALPDGPELRKGAPQAAHVHVVLEAGKDIMEAFYPGICDELQARGARLIDTSRDLAWFHHGVWKARYPSGFYMLLCTRTLLEWGVRQRTAALANVELLDQTAVSGLIASADRRAVLGVTIHPAKDPSQVRELRADLVVDASGRGSRVPGWLVDMGYEAPEEEHIGIDLSYTTCLFEQPAWFRGDWRFIIHYPRVPHDWRAGFLACVEENRWIVSLNGYFKDAAPADAAGFVEYAATLPCPEIHQYIQDAVPISELRVHKIPSSRRRHFAKLSRFPDNLVNVGDSVCAFNPIFGQGMTVAAKGAKLLRELAAEASAAGDMGTVSRRFRKTLPAAIATPWFMATILDLQYPRATGKRPLGHRLLAWYVGKLLEATSSSPRIYQEFSQVLHLKKGIWNVIKPGVSFRVLAYGLKSLFVPLEKRANTGAIPFDVSDLRDKEHGADS